MSPWEMVHIHTTAPRQLVLYISLSMAFGDFSSELSVSHSETFAADWETAPPPGTALVLTIILPLYATQDPSYMIEGKESRAWDSAQSGPTSLVWIGAFWALASPGSFVFSRSCLLSHLLLLQCPVSPCLECFCSLGVCNPVIVSGPACGPRPPLLSPSTPTRQCVKLS